MFLVTYIAIVIRKDVCRTYAIIRRGGDAIISRGRDTIIRCGGDSLLRLGRDAIISRRGD